MSSGTVTEMQRVHSVHTLRGGGDGVSAGGCVSYIGFSNFPNQVFRRCIKDGFSFTRGKCSDQLNWVQLSKLGATAIVKKSLGQRLPFAVVGSTQVKEVSAAMGDRKQQQLVRVREYPWGTVEVDNLAHNDFMTLRDMIIRKHLIDLIDVTRNVHYENYRMRNLPKNSFDGDDPFTRLEQEMRQKENELQDELQHHEQIFKNKVAQRSQQQMDRAQAMDAEERENRKVLEEKRALLDKLKQEVAELKRGNNMSASSLDSGSRSFVSGSSPEKVHPSEQQRIKKLGHRLFGNGGRSGGSGAAV
uniref:Septin-type G domain-containing protein n=1 Tax=Globodera pallida TaxID=36090 RepID=A0A183BV35_GLOPA